MLGPSGSGKTTTLRMIAGFEDPTGGTIELAGEDVSGVPPYDRAVNTVFQDYALFPHMTVGENVAYGLQVAEVAKAERAKRRDEALEMVRLPGYGDRKPGELSGGQRQRVALARAIVNRPKVLLLDEPLGALDLKLREQMQVELKSIQGEVGITFVYVTHDQDEALTMSDRIAVFNDGRIEQVSPPRRALRAARRPSSSPASSASPTCSSATASGFTIRPEKIQLLDAAARADGPAHRARPDRRRRLRGDGDPLHGRARRAAESFSWSGRTSESASPSDACRAGQGGRRGLAPGARGRRPGEVNQRGGITVRKQDAHPARTAWLVVAGLVAFMLLLAGCGSSSSDSGGGGEELQKLGKGEGAAQPDLLGRLRRTRMGEAVRTEDRLQGQRQGRPAPPTKWSQLMRTGQYDGVSASGNATARLVDGGDVDPVNVDLVPNYKTIFADLKDQPYNTFDGSPLRDPARPRRQPADVEQRRRQAGAELLGRDARPEGRGQIQGQDQPVRRPDVDRRSGRLPEVRTNRTWGSKTPTS